MFCYLFKVYYRNDWFFGKFIVFFNEDDMELIKWLFFYCM